MKKLVLSSILFLFTGTLLLAQKTINDANVEKRDVGSFHGVNVGTGIELILTNGNTEEVAVSASDPEFRDRIVTKIDNGILKIYYDSKIGAINKKHATKSLKAYVSYKNLDLLHANTGAEVKIDGVLKSTSLDLEANTGALVDGEIDVNSLKVDQNTGSRITLSGKADKIEISGDTGSKFRGEDLIASECTANVSTGAQVFVKAEKQLEAKANTGGLIKYKGNATQVNIKTHTGGTVSKI